MINALFVLIVFLLQLNKDNLHVKWPISARINVTYDEVTQEVKSYGTSRTCARRHRLTQITLSCKFVCNVSQLVVGVDRSEHGQGRELSDDATTDVPPQESLLIFCFISLLLSLIKTPNTQTKTLYFWT